MLLILAGSSALVLANRIVVGRRADEGSVVIGLQVVVGLLLVTIAAPNPIVDRPGATDLGRPAGGIEVSPWTFHPYEFGDNVTFGNGGGEYGGPAFDPKTGLLYVTANEMGGVLKMVRRDTVKNTGRRAHAESKEDVRHVGHRRDAVLERQPRPDSPSRSEGGPDRHGPSYPGGRLAVARARK